MTDLFIDPLLVHTKDQQRLIDETLKSLTNLASDLRWQGLMGHSNALEQAIAYFKLDDKLYNHHNGARVQLNKIAQAHKEIKKEISEAREDIKKVREKRFR